MAKRTSASNAVGAAVSQVAAMFRVPCYRMNSRVFTVTGAGGRQRPMFMGEWTDDLGIKHFSGMADYLLTPAITARLIDGAVAGLDGMKRTVPLWVECKSGKGVLTPDQKAFRDYAVQAGAFHLEVHDSADRLVQWFDCMGVKR